MRAPTRRASSRLLRGEGAIAVIPAAALVLLFIVPVVFILARSVFVPQASWENYANLFAAPQFLRALGNSLTIAVQSTAISAILGVVILRALLRSPQWVRVVIIVALVMPMVTGGELVRMLSWKIILSPEGPLNTVLVGAGLTSDPLIMVPGRPAVVIGLVHVMLPLFVLTAFAAVRGADERLQRAAQGMGATKLQSFLTAEVPAIMPALIGATLITFVAGLASYATPTGLGGPGDLVLPQLVVDQVQLMGNAGQGAAAGVLLLAIALVVLVILAMVGGLRAMYGAAVGGRNLVAKHHVANLWTGVTTNRSSNALFAAVDRASWLKVLTRVMLGGLTVATAIYLFAPTVVGVAMSFTSSTILSFPSAGFSLRWYEEFFIDPDWTSGTTVSLVVGALSALIATALGTMMALGLVRGRFRGRSALFTLSLMPLIMPWVVTALGLYLLFAFLGIAYTQLGLVLGHVVISFPFAVILMTSALSGFNWQQDRAAQIAGAKPLRRFADVLVPYLRPALLMVLWFSFITSFSEVVFALLMSSTRLHTLPVTMFDGIRYNVSPTVAAAGGVLTLVTVGLFVVGFVLQRLFSRRRSA